MSDQQEGDSPKLEMPNFFELPQEHLENFQLSRTQELSRLEKLYYTHLIDQTINGLTHDDPSVKRKLRQTLIEGIETLKVVCPEEYLSGSTGKEIFENNSERVVDNQASVLGDTLKVIGMDKKSPQKRGKSNKKTDQDDE